MEAEIIQATLQKLPTEAGTSNSEQLDLEPLTKNSSPSADMSVLPMASELSPTDESNALRAGKLNLSSTIGDIQTTVNGYSTARQQDTARRLKQQVSFNI
jgi:hypothetical protein